ncbi:hypothetical protein FA13DRAFT_1796147 [Coprinellus micaceus]|uniref:Uncharacterized protein n=1 Tax=Coprinellus micaceus TaxID=71717 RepID=A0A4Y7SVE5_COPMI|nr:hypothetical protein FA13DRAFT_1796147 [Coprinellus micaceus]
MPVSTRSRRANQPQTKEEWRAQKIQRFGLRNSDAWLEAVISFSRRIPVVVHHPGWLTPAQLLKKDMVKLSLSLAEIKHHDPQSPFLNDSEFMFKASVTVPAQSNFSPKYVQSPTFIFDTYFGRADSPDSPFWVETLSKPTPTEVNVTRLDALELVRVCALLKWNHWQVNDMLHWVEALTRGSFADLNALNIRYPPEAPPLPCTPVKTPYKCSQRIPLRDITHVM